MPTLFIFGFQQIRKLGFQPNKTLTLNNRIVREHSGIHERYLRMTEQYV